MRRTAWALCAVAIVLGACSSKTASTATSTPTSSVAPGAEPKTAQELRAIAQLHFNLFTAGDFGSFWDDFDSSSQAVISRPEYVHRLQSCMSRDPNRSKPFTIVGVADNHNGTWSVVTNYTKYQITFPARYEGGRWRFILSEQVRTSLKMPFDQYIATQCAH